MLYIPLPLKLCTKCLKELSLTQFIKYRNRKGYRSWCRECLRENAKAWKQANPSKVHSQKERWTVENREHIRDYNLNYERSRRKLNVESRRRAGRKYTRVHRDKINQYRRSHPNIRQVEKQKHRARKRALPNAFTTQDWRRCLEHWAFTCAYCGNQPGFLRETKITAEHFIPLVDAICPGTIATNMLPACGSCNYSKSDRPAQAWLVERFGKRRAKAILKRIQDYFKWVNEQTQSH